ncbi:AraC family transcriptional regulator [Spirosoma utsteinense]|uniref:AraC-like DNA-binding protein n=1 Tax=Spirosoma utsteinense TaxID=2585773 RepID=A0ABR6VZI3_9BACT|nr:AraC family transcriptional regulator [Spirosoma utsteinense]MBC3784515.1 AraC-like DNA-binding protein [Spirosoma utsteinense]MBC3789734.1 AraC-like DNA-binding protein [Spirosoma utsteinense]
MILTIRNMVCDRCKRAVRDDLGAMGLTMHRVELGEVEVDGLPPGVTLDDVRRVLVAGGFELIDDRKHALVEHMKALLINEVNHLKGDRLPTENYSAFLERKLGYEYSYLSGLFSGIEGQTVEKYTIALKIEKVKEWLRYDELTLTEMAWRLSYSSVQHLSNQFRQVTGQTPGQFKKLALNARRPLDSI